MRFFLVCRVKQAFSRVGFCCKIFIFFGMLHFFCMQLVAQKLRVLHFAPRYPWLTQTYMHEEIASILDDYEVKVISLYEPELKRKNYFSYQFVRRSEKNFFKKIDKLIKDFKPHVMHSHSFPLIMLLNTLADKYQIPYTLRTHSGDVFVATNEKLALYSKAANSPLCLGVLGFPEFKEKFLNHGFIEKKVIPCWPVINYQRFYNNNLDKPIQKRILGVGAAISKKKHEDFVDLAATMKNDGIEFNLYIPGGGAKIIDEYNKKMNNPVKSICSVEPEEMPQVYQAHDWLVYTADQEIRKVGLPVAIAEAQASGIGVCWQELPGRRKHQLEYLGGAGFLFKSINELPEILRKPYPKEMRLRGIENAKKSDIAVHKHLLTDLWDALDH